MWDYYALFAYLIKKDPLEFTGIETYLYEKVWVHADVKAIFPIGKSIVYEAAKEASTMYGFDNDEEDDDELARHETSSGLDDTKIMGAITKLAKQVEHVAKWQQTQAEMKAQAVQDAAESDTLEARPEFIRTNSSMLPESASPEDQTL